MKTSADDVLVAYISCLFSQSSKPINRYIDLGCGIGSTLLLVAHELTPCHAIGIEAQEQSYQLARKSIDAINASSTASSLTVVHRDLRDHGMEPNSAQLITANPPYSPMLSGTLCQVHS